MSEPTYIIQKSLTGKITVYYECSACKEGLANPLSKAGESDKCPVCEGVHMVPGVTEWEGVEAQRIAAIEDRKAQIALGVEARRAQHAAEAEARRAAQNAQWHYEQAELKLSAISWSGTAMSVLGGILFVASIISFYTSGPNDLRGAITGAAEFVAAAVFLVGGGLGSALTKILRQLGERK
ncbi:MAG: hypothetical protein EXS00_08330 [Phycisphaerales bacterium]|nr:hypothetical protein [Phycisphaerales bacterium]